MSYLQKIFKSINAISVVTGFISAVIMGLIGFIVTYEIIMRYIFKSPTGWTLDFVPYLILWGAFLGAAVTLKEDKHIKVDLLTCRLSHKTQKIIEIGTGIIGIIFCIILCIKGIQMVLQTKHLGSVDASSLSIPRYIPQLCIPIGAFLILLEFMKRLINDILSLKNVKFKEEKG